MDNNQVYLMYINELFAYKIGVSKNSKKRIKQLQTGCPYKIELRSFFVSKHAYRLEKVLHRKYSHLKLDEEEIKMSGEWYALGIVFPEQFLEECKKIEDTFTFLEECDNPFL